MIFENDQDLNRERAAIKTYTDLTKGSYQKLGPNDVDYKLFDKDKNISSYAEVKVLATTIQDSFPLSLSARKVLKLIDKRLNPVLIWGCLDGIIYGRPQFINGQVSWSEPEVDLEIKYNNKKEFKYVRK